MPDLPAWWGRDRQRQNTRSARQERHHAAQEGGRVQAGSGSSWRAPHDVVTPEFLDELKFTDAKSFRLDAGYFRRLRRSARRMGREPRLIIEFPNLKLVVTEYEEPPS